MRAEVDNSTWRQTERVPAAQTFGAVILDFADNGALAGAECVQRAQIAAGDGSLTGWNRMPVRVFQRLAQMSSDGLFQTRRNSVFQRLGLGIDLAPVQAKHTRQQQFYQAMTANDASRLADALWRQLRSAAGFIIDPASLSQTLEHACHRRGAYLQTFGDGQRRHHSLGAVEAVNRLQVILHSSARLFCHHIHPPLIEGSRSSVVILDEI